MSLPVYDFNLLSKWRETVWAKCDANFQLRRRNLWPRYSRLLVRQIQRGEKTGLDPDLIAASIASHESGPDLGLRGPQPFEGSLLRGYCKAHIWGVNLLTEMASNMIFDKNSHTHGQIYKHFAPKFGQKITKQDIEKFASLVCEGAINHKAGRQELSGEWIIFRPTKFGNIYLCLSPHAERDEQRHARAERAWAEFKY